MIQGIFIKGYWSPGRRTATSSPIQMVLECKAPGDEEKAIELNHQAPAKKTLKGSIGSYKGSFKGSFKGLGFRA